MAPNVPLATVVFAAVAAVALRAAARRSKPPQAPGTRPAPVTVMAGQSQSQPQTAVTTGTHDGTRGELARPPAPCGRPASAVDQAQHIFPELHPMGATLFARHATASTGQRDASRRRGPVAGQAQPGSATEHPFGRNTGDQAGGWVVDRIGGYARGFGPRAGYVL
jgi:hypothetical protein